MNELLESIKQGLREAIQFAEGDTKKARVFDATAVDVKHIRIKVGMTQEEFAATFGIKSRHLAPLGAWRLYTACGPAFVVLNLIQKYPAAIMKVIAQ